MIMKNIFRFPDEMAFVCLKAIEKKLKANTLISNKCSEKVMINPHGRKKKLCETYILKGNKNLYVFM